MMSRYARLITACAFGFGMIVLQAARSEAAPITITDVRVVIGPSTYTATGVGWTFPRTLDTGQDLVLTQSYNGAPDQTNSFNFDTSDVVGTGNVAQITITVDGIATTFQDTNQVLNVKGLDSISLIDNEAQNYGLLAAPAGLTPGYQVFVGYADNVHTGACGGWVTTIGLAGSTTCLPSPFLGATIFDGAAGFLPDVAVPTQRLPNHCLGGPDILTPTCFEAGVIRIVATGEVDPRSVAAPEPASFTLLMTGAGILFARRFRRGQGTRT